MKIFERVVLLQLLPEQGNLTTILIVRKLREKLSFTEEEHKEFNLRQEGERLLWDNEKDIDKEIEFGEKEKDIIVESLKKLNSEKSLTEKHLSLWDKFIEKGT